MVRRKAKPRNDLEHQLQKSFFEWLQLQYPDIFKVTFAIPNAAKRSFVTAAKLKEEGLKSGVPDVFIAKPAGGLSGLFIEFKVKPNSCTEKQAEMIKLFNANGYLAIVCFDIDSAMQLLSQYLAS